jgi:hypothetical protein
MASHHAALLDAIRGLGVEPNLCNKIIIEIGFNGPVRLHVQGYADEGTLGVIKAADGDLEVVREVAGS